MSTLPFLNQLRERVRQIRNQTCTDSAERVFENLDRCLREIDEAMLEEARRTDVTLDASDPNQQAFSFLGAASRPFRTVH